MSKQLIEKRKEFEAKQDKLHSILKEAGPEHDMDKITSLQGDSKAKVEAIQKLNLELSDLGKQVETLVELEKAWTEDEARQKAAEQAARDGLPQPGPSFGGPALKSIGRQFVESADFKSYQKNPGGTKGVEVDIPLKTLMTTAAGFAPESLRTGEVVPYVRRPPRMLDIIPFGRTTQAAIVYMEQTTRVNNAAEVAEGNVLGEAQMVWTQRSQTVETVGVWQPVTGQQLEDVDQIESIINVELMAMLRERMSNQSLVGTGATPQIIGLLVKAGVQTVALAGDRFDATYNQLKLIRTTGRSSPDHFIFHPNDWQEVRLARTDDGLYILGNPNQEVDRLWGMQIVETDAETEGTVLAGEFATWCKIYEKRGILVESTDSEHDDFSHFKYAIRATTRVAMVITRPVAFCKLTGF